MAGLYLHPLIIKSKGASRVVSEDPT